MRKTIEIKESVPKGWRRDKGATTAPKGYAWISNGKSRFKGERKSALVLESVLKKYEREEQENDQRLYANN